MKSWALFRVTTIVLVCNVMTWVFTGMRLYRLQMLWYLWYCRIWAYEWDTNQNVLNFSYSQVARLNLNAVAIDQLLSLAKYDLACSIYLYGYNSYDYRDRNYGFSRFHDLTIPKMINEHGNFETFSLYVCKCSRKSFCINKGIVFEWRELSLHEANVSSLVTYSVDKDLSSDLIGDDEDYICHSR